MPLEPLGSEETEKARRRVETTLLADRVLRPQTRTRCEQLLDQLLVENMHLTLEQLLGKREADAELVSKALVTYGKQLLYSGKSHGRYSETINAVAAKRPTLKRLLAGAWDLAFAWVTDEPHAHHPATPLSVVLPLAVLHCYWGWPVEASLILMTWTGILRVGEVLARGAPKERWSTWHDLRSCRSDNPKLEAPRRATSPRHRPFRCGRTCDGHLR